MTLHEERDFCTMMDDAKAAVARQLKGPLDRGDGHTIMVVLSEFLEAFQHAPKELMAAIDAGYRARGG